MSLNAADATLNAVVDSDNSSDFTAETVQGWKGQNVSNLAEGRNLAANPAGTYHSPWVEPDSIARMFDTEASRERFGRIEAFSTITDGCGCSPMPIPPPYETHHSGCVTDEF